MKPKQSLKDGTTVRFSFKDLPADEEWVELTGLSLPTLKGLEGKKAKVVDLETYTELGNKDYEYYNIKFPHLKEELVGISGFHLTKTK